MNKKVLIAGASRGLGLFLTQRYLELGDTVFAGVRNTGAPHIAALAATYGGRLFPVEMDVSNTSSVTRAVTAVSEHTNTLDILINNAGIHCASSFAPLPEADLDDCLAVYNVNAIGPLRVIKAFDNFLSTGARIINISSESGSIGLSGRKTEFDYCMSKAAMNMSSKILQNGVADRGIKVLAIQPGWMRTDMGGTNADLDPYETACKLVDLFADYAGGAIFLDNDGTELVW